MNHNESMTAVEEEQIVEQIREGSERIRRELSKVIIGQHDVIEQLLVSLMAGGHCLITGAPGLAKTLLVSSVASIFHLQFKRIQFTPDLMPADITGTEILEEDADGHRKLTFVKGPIFANVILADEINRTPPKTQAALLEAMQEHQVTASGRRYELEEPFFVLATQNPIEMEGTYPLPEAQLDRFMFNVLIDYLPPADELSVVLQTTSSRPEPIEPIYSGEDVLRVSSSGATRSDRRRSRGVRRATRFVDPTRTRRNARFYESMGQLGCWSSCGTNTGARRQSTCIACRKCARQHR